VIGRHRVLPSDRCPRPDRFAPDTDLPSCASNAHPTRQERALVQSRRLLFDWRLTLFTNEQHMAGNDKHHHEGSSPEGDGGLAPDVFGLPKIEDSEHRCQAGEPNPSSTVHPPSMPSDSSGHWRRPPCSAAHPRTTRTTPIFGGPLIGKSGRVSSSVHRPDCGTTTGALGQVRGHPASVSAKDPPVTHSVRRVRDSRGFGKRYPNQAAVAGSSPTAVRLAYPCCARVGR
jgi:hypothetical protein